MFSWYRDTSFLGTTEDTVFSHVLILKVQEGLIQLQKIFPMMVATDKHSNSELQNRVKVTISHDAC